MPEEVHRLSAAALARYDTLRPAAVQAVTRRFYKTEGSAYAQFGERGRQACRQDLDYHLEFLRPVLEFGWLTPLVDYLVWLQQVLQTRGVPDQHLGQSLLWLAEFFEQRWRSRDGASVATALRAAHDRFVRAAMQASSPAAPCCPAPWPQSERLQVLLLAGRQAEAAALIQECLDAGHGLIDVEMHVIQPALYGIGERWQRNEVSVIQEHMATAIAQSLMTMALQQCAPPPNQGKMAVLACVEGNQHAVGLRMVADTLIMGGWEVQFLGANVPTVGLIRHVQATRPQLVGLSVSFAQQLPAVRAVIQGLVRELGPERPPVMIGGLAINRFTPLAGLVGAAGSSPDARATLLAAEQLLSAQPESGDTGAASPQQSP